MATVRVDGSTMTVEMSGKEKLATWLGDLEVDRRLVTGATVSDDPFGELRGIRAPGVALPRTVAMGRWRSRSGTDFVLVRRGQRGVVIDLAPEARYRRLVLGVDDPEAVVAQLA